MCEHCDQFDQRIQKFRRFLAQPIDPLTAERLTAAVKELEAARSALHPEQK